MPLRPAARKSSASCSRWPPPVPRYSSTPARCRRWPPAATAWPPPAATAGNRRGAWPGGAGDAGQEHLAVGVHCHAAGTAGDQRQGGRFHPPRSHHQVVAPQAGRVVDRPGRLRSVRFGQVGRHEAGHFAVAHRGRELLSQRRHAATQLPGRPAEAQGVEVAPRAEAVVEDESHGRNSLRWGYGKFRPPRGNCQAGRAWG